jgi:hypothetical protein
MWRAQEQGLGAAGDGAAAAPVVHQRGAEQVLPHPLHDPALGRGGPGKVPDLLLERAQRRQRQRPGEPPHLPHQIVQRRGVGHDEGGEARRRRAVPGGPAGGEVGGDAVVIDRRDVALAHGSQADRRGSQWPSPSRRMPKPSSTAALSRRMRSKGASAMAHTPVRRSKAARTRRSVRYSPKRAVSFFWSTRKVSEG